MSKELPEPIKSEEIDLVQIFKYFERLFKKLKDLLVSLFGLLVFILKKVSIFFLICASVFKKHIIPIGLAGIVGYAAFYGLDKTSPPVYSSSVILKQNFRTGRVLYNTINRYNSLAGERDSVSLGRLMNIPSEKAAKIIGVEIYDDMNRNTLRDRYYRYIKDVDSTLIIPFNLFAEDYDLENVGTQIINVYSVSTSVYENLTEGLVKGFESNAYFTAEKEKELSKIKSKIDVYKQMLVKSDTLQYEYLELLKNYYVNTKDDSQQRQSTLNLNLANNKDKIDTKEFQLFEEQKAINMTIVELEEELKNKREVFSVQSEFKPAIIVMSRYAQQKKNAALVLAGIVFLFFLLRHLGASDIISQYGTKEELIK